MYVDSSLIALGGRCILPYFTDKETEYYMKCPQISQFIFAELESEQPDSESVTQKFFKGTKETMFICSQPLQYPLLCAANFIFKYQGELIIDEMEPSNLNKDFNDQTHNPK